MGEKVETSHLTHNTTPPVNTASHSESVHIQVMVILEVGHTVLVAECVILFTKL